MRLGKYEVLGPIGIGGFGRVWLAREIGGAAVRGTSNLVAIKRLRRARLQQGRTRNDVSRFEQAFKLEAEIGSHLRHPNIVRLIEQTRIGADYLLVMEFINGIGLDELLGQFRQVESRLSAALAIAIIIQVGRGLHHAHTVGDSAGRPLHIVHRDVKPSNIMIGRDGLVRVMDFGVARSILKPGRTTTGTIKGTLRYLSPEQAQGARNIGPETDQFALGLVLGEILIGQPVYAATHDHEVLMRAMKHELGAAIEISEKHCPGIAPIMDRALQHNPDDRFPSVAAMVFALEELSERQGYSPSLVDCVHKALEARARWDENHFEQEDTQQNTDVVNILGEDDQQSEILAMPIGWAHEQFSALDSSDGHSATEPNTILREDAESLLVGTRTTLETTSMLDDDGPVMELIIEDTSDEELDPWHEEMMTHELTDPIIAELPNGAEGWAMLPARRDEIDFELLKRGPPTDEWSASPPAQAERNQEDPGKRSIYEVGSQRLRRENRFSK